MNNAQQTGAAVAVPPIFTRAQLLERMTPLAPSFAAAAPFPHVVMDDFLPSDVADVVRSEFPSPTDPGWYEYDAVREKKLALRDEEALGPVTRRLLQELNGQVFLQALTALTGIPELIPDPYYVGGGLHQIVAGGLLKVHADFALHLHNRLQRRLNLIVYLNPDWTPDWGGQLELWDKAMSHAVGSVEPLMNRALVFQTDPDAYHGHPDPLTVPPGHTRKSLALYYYTNTSDSTATHRTTLFHARPGEDLKATWQERLRRWVPPAVMEARARAKGRNPYQ